MIGYVTVGADDLGAAERFYSAVLLRIGYGLEVSGEGLSYALRSVAGGVGFYVKPPFDGRPARSGNGAMVAFEVQTQALVRELHALGVSAGGREDGAPGFRAEYSAGFYVGYLRDPQGNKIALYCSNPEEPQRPA